MPPEASFRTIALNMPVHSSVDRLGGVAGNIMARCHLTSSERDLACFSLRALPHMLAYRPDIIMLANHFWPVVAAKAGRLFGGQGRIVITSQVGWWYVTQDDLRLGIDGFVAIQPQTYESAVQFSRGKTPVRLIPNGVDIERFACGPLADIPLVRPVVIMVAALVDYKRVHLAVRAVAQAGMSLLLLGDGPNATDVLSLAHTLLGPRRFLHLSDVAHNEVADYYRAADVFTLSSTAAEGFGIAIIEAMAAGLPVVVNDDPVRRWIAGQRGLFVDPEDTDSYAQALLSAVSRGKISPANCDLSRFDWQTVARQHAEFFEQLRV